MAAKRIVEDAGRQCLLLPGDIGNPEHCRDVITKTVEAFGRIDVLVNNAAHQSYFESLEEIPDEEWEKTLAVNISAMFYLTKAAVPHMKPGARSSMPRPSRRTNRARNCSHMPSPRGQSRTSALGWRSFSPRRASGPILLRQGRYGHRSVQPAFPSQTLWGLANRSQWGVRHSRENSRRLCPAGER